MPHDCPQIKILTKQPVTLFFLKACFVLDTIATEHIICKNEELGISCNIGMSERVLYGGKQF